MLIRKLLKLKHEPHMLELDVQLWGLKLYSLIVNKEGEVGQPFTTNDVGENHEGNEVNCVLPPRFDEHEEQQDDDSKGTREAFIILGSPQKFELKLVEITKGFERYLIQEECPYHQQE